MVVPPGEMAHHFPATNPTLAGPAARQLKFLGTDTPNPWEMTGKHDKDGDDTNNYAKQGEAR